MSELSVVRVALAIPLRALFDYLLPAEMAESGAIVPGVRVRVPFGHGERVGLVVELPATTMVSADLLKPVISVLDEKALLRQQDLDFQVWAASYYQHPVGEVLLASLPVRLRNGKTLVEQLEKAWKLTEAGRVMDVEELSRAPRQQQLLLLLRKEYGKNNPVMRQSVLENLFPGAKSLVKSLEKKRLVSVLEVAKQLNKRSVSEVPHWPLNPEQLQAVEQCVAVSGFKVFALNGVTGSGKTEVYLAITREVLQRQKQILILVPEISLTPQLIQRFANQIDAEIAVLHSGLSETGRCYAWQRAASGEAQVVIGTRSAIFTPLPSLGLVVVDEEHDLSFKQQEGFRYSARDLAVVLGQRADCPVVLGSATLSLETMKNIATGNYSELLLTERAGQAVFPRLDLIDVRSVRLKSGLSPVSIRLMEENLRAGNQVLVFINRRGYAPVLTCHDCGWVDQCQQCDARMTLHLERHVLWCHHCGYRHRLPVRCPDCHSEQLLTLGQGSEQLEEALSGLFPDYGIVRIDRDSTRLKGSLEEKLKAIHAGKYAILVGTQMLSKGHDFPGVTLAVLLDIDHGLYGSDFRAAERMAQQIIQVAGRAGRGQKPGHVLIQTRHPDHPLLQTLVHEGYGAFARQALNERQEVGFPPGSYQVLVRAEATDSRKPEAFLQAARETGTEISGTPEFMGPVPAVMQKKAGKHRYHLLLQSLSRGGLHSFLRQWLPLVEALPLARQVRWTVDVDPQDFYS